MFGHPACRPCKGFMPKYRKLAKGPDFEAHRFSRVSWDKEDEDSKMIYKKYEITHTPTFIIFRGGEELARYKGVSETRLGNAIKEVAASQSMAVNKQTAAPVQSIYEQPAAQKSIENVASEPIAKSATGPSVEFSRAGIMKAGVSNVQQHELKSDVDEQLAKMRVAALWLSMKVVNELQTQYKREETAHLTQLANSVRRPPYRRRKLALNEQPY